MPNSATKVEAISITSPSAAGSINVAQSTYQALHALRASDGLVSTVKNEDLLALQVELGTREGIYAEPSSIAVLVAIRNLRSEGQIQEGDTVVAVLTATGLKDPAATENLLGDIPVVRGDIGALLGTLSDAYGYKT